MSFLATAVSAPMFAPISASTSGNNTLVAASAGRKIRVLSVNFIAADAVNATFKSGSVAVSGAYPLTAQSGAALGYSPVGHFETVAGQALVLTLDGAVQVSGCLTYVLV